MLVDVPRFTGGTKWMGAFGVAGIVGLLGTLFFMFAGGEARADAWHSYLAAYAWAVATAVGGLLLLLILHAANAKWPTVLRRPMEAVAGTLPVLFILGLPLLIPVLTRDPVLFSWLQPEEKFTAQQMHHFHGAKHTYLNPTFFLVRQVIYWAVFLGVSTVVLTWSKKLDELGGHEWIAKSRRLAAGSIPFVGLALTWFSIDWLMTLTPFWQQTIFGVYYFAGGFLSAICIVTLSAILTRDDRALFGWWVTKHHQHNMGKLMLAFTAFWAYIGFSQLMLVWVANLPEEVPYYWIRLKSSWVNVSTFLIFGHFALPFVLLVPRTTKYIPKLLAALCVWILFTCMVDEYWLVLPALHEDGPHFHLSNILAYLGVGGIAAAFGIFRLRGRYLIPVRDPYLEDSLRYVQP